MTTVLVTGATGTIGRAVIKALSAHGDVTIRAATRRPELLRADAGTEELIPAAFDWDAPRRPATSSRPPTRCSCCHRPRITRCRQSPGCSTAPQPPASGTSSRRLHDAFFRPFVPDRGRALRAGEYWPSVGKTPHLVSRGGQQAPAVRDGTAPAG